MRSRQAGRVDVTRRSRPPVASSSASSTTGRAFRADVRERMFEPFFTTKPVGQGTGLGLDIVRRLVSHNDAEIERRVRAGSNRVPRLAAGRRTTPTEDAREQARMLVVDDDAAGAGGGAPRPARDVIATPTRSSAPSSGEEALDDDSRAQGTRRCRWRS